MPDLNQEFYSFGRYCLSPSRHTLYCGETEVSLTPKSFEVLLYLARNPGRIVTKDELLKAVWQDAFIEEANLAQQIFRLRRAFESESDTANLIRTIPGRGYQFTADVQNSTHIATAPSTPTALYDVEQWRERTRFVVEELAVAGKHDATPSSRLTSKVLGITVAVIALAALTLFGIQRWLHRVIPGDHHEIVLADFENTTGEPDFDKVLNNVLSVDLRQTPFLLVASDTKIMRTLKLMEKPVDTRLSPPIARELCQRIGGQAVLNGLIARFGQQYLITLAASDCTSGNTLAATKATAANRDGVLQAIDNVAADMRQRLGEPLKSRREFNQPMISVETGSLEALKAYSQGKDIRLTGKEQDAIPFFERAIEIDPRFATAYADLGTVYSNLGQPTLSAANITKAFELRDLADEQTRLAIIALYSAHVSQDYLESIRNLETWTQVYPEAPSPHINLANSYNQIGRFDLSVVQGKRAVALDPDSPIGYIVLARAQVALNQVQDAIATCNQAIARKVDNEALHGVLLQIASLQHDSAGIDKQVEWAKGTRSEPYITLEYSLASYAAGRAKLGKQLMDDVVDGYKKQGMQERANRMAGGVPRLQTYMGQLDLARKTISEIKPADDSTDFPVALALTGDIVRAEAMYHHDLQTIGKATLFQYYDGPQIASSIAMARHKPEDAITALSPAIPYNLRSTEVSALRGNAYLALHQPQLAIVEFQRIADFPGVEPWSPNVALCHLGLARAYTQQNKPADARREYEIFFTLWRDADNDLPILKQARAEYAQLGH
jgi:DNA-binding winged helix-turn-helix (wHTH) protein/tetratricopeptide (TPR) repeat protein